MYTQNPGRYGVKVNLNADWQVQTDHPSILAISIVTTDVIFLNGIFIFRTLF